MQNCTNRKLIKTSQYTLMPVFVAQEGSSPVSGRKIVKSGTILGGRSLSVYCNIREPVIKKNNSEADGVLLYDVDVTNGLASGLLIIHGIVSGRCLPEAVTAEAAAALDKISFIK